MPQRTPRSEIKPATRAALLDAANEVFLERGFHAASVSEISERAGYSTGAIYSNFGGKDDLFLSALDRQLARSAEAQSSAVAKARTFEAGVRAAARQLYDSGAREPARTPLTIEFWTYASGDPDLRARLLALHERQVETIAGVVESLAAKHGVRFRIPVREVARGGGALSRGLRLERLIDPEGGSRKQFEEMFVAYVMGLTETTKGEAR